MKILLSRTIVFLPLVVLSIILMNACRVGDSTRFSWQELTPGQTVYGIVNLTVKLDQRSVDSLSIYLDDIDESHLLGAATSKNGRYYLEWYTTGAANGDHVLHAVVSRKDNSQICILFTTVGTVSSTGRPKLISMSATANRL